jgi:hypothetical protein
MKTTDYLTARAEIDKIQQIKRIKYDYCHAIIQLKGIYINSLKEEDLMLLEAKIITYKQVFKSRKPGLQITLQNKPIEYWENLIQKRYEYCVLIEREKELWIAINTIRQIQSRTNQIQDLKQRNKEDIKILEAIVL